MFTTGTQFDITEEGLEGLEGFRQSDFLQGSGFNRVEYHILTILDLSGLTDYPGLFEQLPRSIHESDVNKALTSLEGKGWIAIER